MTMKNTIEYFKTALEMLIVIIFTQLNLLLQYFHKFLFPETIALPSGEK